MPFASTEEDSRKVQTAVVGRAESARPVFLPYDHDDFDRFMLGRTREDFYCGVLLGGCGKKLTAKRYLEKKCHFAHRPPVHCRRTETGEASADHLYVAEALQRWLEGQGHQDIGVTFLEPGSPHGGAVEVRFGPRRSRVIRVQMARMSVSEWQETRDRLARSHTHVHWAYGPYCGLSHDEVKVAGHAIRISCRTEGHTRVVYAGTQRPDNSLAWAPLADCHVTDKRIVTSPPDTEATGPVAFPLAPGTIAFTAATELPASGTAALRLYEADVQPIGSAMVRARIALPLDHPIPPPHQLHVIYASAHLVTPTDSTPSEPVWLIRAGGALPLLQDVDPRWPDLHPAAPLPDQPSPSPLPLGERVTILAFRSQLDSVARSHTLITWEMLIRHTKAAPADITPEDRVRLLVAVDHPRANGKPVLTSLLKPSNGGTGPVPYFGEVLAGLGWKRDLPEARVTAICEQERKTAYALSTGGIAPSCPPAATAPVRRVPPVSDEEIATRLRERLELIAKSHGVVKLTTLLKKLGLRESTMPSQRQVRLLAMVDMPYAPGNRLLSALVKVSGSQPEPPSFYKDVLTELGWNPNTTTPNVEAAWKAGRDRAYLEAKRKPVQAPPTEQSADWTRLGTSRADAVEAVRQALISAARRQVCVDWQTLADAAGLKLTDLSVNARESILIGVDSSVASHGVLLSSLVVSSGHSPVPYFGAVLKHLGRPHNLRPIELGQVRKTEQARAFAAYNTVSPEEA
ncbi:competence protein CoiA family protein [Streptomyces acidiscabies]|uniref:competence protein CoiA family protein n=1 Tax=Streptomyces acidiscabies TaxID=42234 RepID=UPI000B17A111|nr:competence protein CoiA family protein [Streptomyces acidiscabies]